MLQAFIEEHAGRIEHDETARANQELRQFWEKYVSGNTEKYGAFVGVLKELRLAIVEDTDLLAWYYDAAKPVLTGTTFKRQAEEDAQDFVASLLIYDEGEENAQAHAKTSEEICCDLLGIYQARTRGLTDEDQFIAPENVQIAQHVENVLVAYGKKMPKHIFQHLDILIEKADTRLQGLTLLSSFLRHQAPHLYTAIETPLVDHLLICLMNDTSTTVLSVAITCLIMLLPHIPASLSSRLPRLFLIYSRLLCWERFSALSSVSQKNLVTDSRYPMEEEDEKKLNDHGDVGLDVNWEKARPKEGEIQAATPELMTYYTYLYGLYPLHFMSYIRKPRRYLKNLDFPGADEFDLDRAVIRSRSDQFRQVHLLHPNFYNMTLEEELVDPKWPKMDAADVVAECHSLAITARPSYISPGPPPAGKLPDPPSLPPSSSTRNGSVSVSPSASLRSTTGSSWRDSHSHLSSTTTAEVESPILGTQHEEDEPLSPRSRVGEEKVRHSTSLDDFPMPGTNLGSLHTTSEKQGHAPSNLSYLQREITLLRNDLNFERWHKSQYSQHIGQLMRKNIKDATVEAETLNLINANRALKQQLEQVRSAREATIKDSNLTRKQASNLEREMSERFNKMKKEQETWVADAEELRKLRAEMKHYRDQLSAAEARELNKSHRLEMIHPDLGQLEQLQSQLQEARAKAREMEYREFEFEQAKREVEILQSEKDTLKMKLERQEIDRERAKRVYADRITELEVQNSRPSSATFHRSRSPQSDSPTSSSSPAFLALQQSLNEAQGKLAALKKAHTRLLERHTDLELDYQSLRSQAAGPKISKVYGSIRSTSHNGSLRSETSDPDFLSTRRGIIESEYDLASEYGTHSEISHTNVSSSDPSSRRYQPQHNNHHQDRNYDHNRGLPISPISMPKSEPTPHLSRYTHRPAPSMNVTRPVTERSKSNTSTLVFNKTEPLKADERSVRSGEISSGSPSQKEREKERRETIKPQSEIRVYGRGEY
jgi:hypothetical protein